MTDADPSELETEDIFTELAAIADAACRDGQARDYTPEEHRRRDRLAKELRRRDDYERAKEV